MSDPLPVAILVEDERQIRRFVRTALEAEGWSVHEADTLRQGLIDSGTRKPDLIILDLMLPDVDGLVLCSGLKAIADVPIVICSATQQKRDAILGMALPADPDDEAG